MKTVFWIFICLLLSNTYSQAQDFSSLEQIKLETEADYKTNEPTALKCAKHLLESPIKGSLVEQLNSAYASKWLMDWMEGTPDYTFAIESFITKLASGSNNDLVMVYLAAQVEHALEGSKENVQLYAAQKLVTFCKDSSKNVKKTGAVKKFLKKADQGDLESYIE